MGSLLEALSVFICNKPVSDIDNPLEEGHIE